MRQCLISGAKLKDPAALKCFDAK